MTSIGVSSQAYVVRSSNELNSMTMPASFLPDQRGRRHSSHEPLTLCRPAQAMVTELMNNHREAQVSDIARAESKESSVHSLRTESQTRECGVLIPATT